MRIGGVKIERGEGREKGRRGGRGKKMRIGGVRTGRGGGGGEKGRGGGREKQP